MFATMGIAIFYSETTMELDAVYGYLYVQKGKQQQAAPPGLAVELAPSRPARGRDRDTLFVHLNLTSRDTPSTGLYHGVVDALARAYFDSSGSVTAALRQAIRAANEHLMHYNMRIEGVDKQQAGVTCAVLREEEMFVVQAGMALAFFSHQGQLERLPPQLPGHVTPLGMGYGVDTRFYHSWVHPGDVLLLAEPGFGGQENGDVQQAITYEGVSAGLDNLAALCTTTHAEEARLLLVEFTVAAELEAQPEPAPAPRSTVSARSPKEPAPTPAPAPAPAAADTPSKDTPRERKPPKPAIKIKAPEVDVEENARKAASGLASGLSRLTGGIGQMMEHLFAPDDGQAVRKSGPNPVALAVLAIFIPILVALIAVTVYLQRGRSNQFQDLLVQMDQESRLAIEYASDEAASHAHWMNVLEISEEALALRPNNETVYEFRDRAYEKLDILDQVTRLHVRTLYTYQNDGTPDGLAVQSLNVYVLDSGIDYAYKHLLENEYQAVESVDPETILFKNQAVGLDAVGELVDLIWFPKTGQVREDTVTILDAAGLLLQYRPAWGNVLSSRLVLPATWSTPVAIATYGDSFYVLDTGANQIWRFAAQDGGYPQEPDAYRFVDNEDGDPSNDVDLTGMIDMAIDRDGNLYLLGQDGSIAKFFGGERKPFDLTGLEDPLVAPSAIYCSLAGLNPLFYIADPGSGRVIQTTQQGLFMAQYRARGADLNDPFAGITDLVVQEAPVMYIYATSGNSLIVASLE